MLVIGCVLIGFVDLSWHDFKSMKANEWGDFLAGFFAPLAFFWFVMAFLQQGAELRASVNQFTHQAKALEETNVLETQKLSIAEWDRLHLEMSGILSQYLYHHFNASNSDMMTSDDHYKQLKSPKKLVPNGGVNPSEFIGNAWGNYSSGDKNTFFRTVYNHTKWKTAPPVLKKILGRNSQKCGRYLQLQNQLQSLVQDESVANNLLMTEEMIGIASFLSSQT